MAAGCVCFYNPIGALPETIGDKGIPLPKSEKKIIRTIVNTMSNEEKTKNLRERARAWAMKQDWSRVAEKFYAIIKNNEQSITSDKTD